MPDELSVTLAQIASTSEPTQSRARAVEALRLADTRLVVFPEAMACDFGSVGARLSQHAEALDGPFVTALVEQAGDRVVVAGMFETSSDPHRPFNTTVVLDRDGVKLAYRKVHLYDSFGYQESQVLLAGSLDQEPLFRVDAFTLGLMTCYDLRFPELARRLAGRVDGYLVPAAWAAGPHKVRHRETLLAARAIENVAYVVGAGQPGSKYVGHSMVIDPWGSSLCVIDHDEPELARAHLRRDVIGQARRTNPSLSNRRLP